MSREMEQVFNYVIEMLSAGESIPAQLLGLIYYSLFLENIIRVIENRRNRARAQNVGDNHNDTNNQKEEQPPFDDFGGSIGRISIDDEPLLRRYLNILYLAFLAISPYADVNILQAYSDGFVFSNNCWNHQVPDTYRFSIRVHPDLLERIVDFITSLFSTRFDVTREDVMEAILVAFGYARAAPKRKGR